MRYRLIVFDWDGTLFDSAGVIAECIQQAARDMALPVPDRDTARHVIGLGLQDSLRHAMPMLSEERYPDFLARYRRLYLEREDSLTLFEGVDAMLAALKSRGHLLAVATGKPRRGLDRALSSSKLGALFDATRCGDETRSKPDPLMLLQLMEELDLASKDLLMIGDTSHDLGMAQNAHVDAVAVGYGAHPIASFSAWNPRASVRSVAELGQWLTQNA
ncbi:MAG: HAD family hydrolase [Burkholderiales bacterium]